MKKETYFQPLSFFVILSVGWVFRMCFEWSDKAAWSYIISSVYDTPWNVFKPFALAYMGWILVELSCLRPHLLHFVCAKSVGLYALFGLIFIFMPLLCQFISFELAVIPVSVISIAVSVIISYAVYKSKFPVEIFRLPLILTYIITVILIVILTKTA